jgi:hypothetical protein
MHDPPLSRRVQEPHPNPSVLPPWRGRCLLVFTQVNPSTNRDCTRLRYRLDEEAGFAGDYSRVKSYAWGTPSGDNHNKVLPTHTLNSKQWVGPLALMSGNRIIRGGRGSVGVWNIDSLEIHGTSGKDRIGGDFNTEDTWRDDPRAIEKFAGSAPRLSSKIPHSISGGDVPTQRPSGSCSARRSHTIRRSARALHWT